MGGGASRIVRIPARRGSVDPRPETPAPAAATPRDATGPGPYEANRSGTSRALRSFLGFAAATLAIYAAFVSLFAASPTPGVRENPLGYAVFSIFGGAVIAVAYAMTLRTAPRGLHREPTELVIVERDGRRRRFSSDPALLRPLVLKRYRPGPLNDASVVLLQLVQPDGRRRSYLLEEGLIPAPAAPR